MRNKKFRKRMTALVMSTVLLIPAPVISAEEQEPMRQESQTRAADVNGFEIENGVLKKYTGKAEHVEIPGTVTAIGELAFSECDFLKSVVIPGTVKSIGTSAFYGCNTLGSVRLNTGLESIGELAFYASGVSSISIPGSVKKLSFSAFMACKSLKRVTIAEGTTELGSAVFNGCSALEDVELPGTLTVIGSKAFGSCTSLKSITIPKGVKTIGNTAFQMCTNLTSVFIPETVKEMGKDVFKKCGKLTIYGKKGSYIETWAKENNIPFGNVRNISSCEITVHPDSYVWDGKEKTPEVTIKDGSYTLKEKTDYTLEYRNNINPGTATVVITGTGKYTGTVEKTFTIYDKEKESQTLDYRKSYNKIYGDKSFNLNVRVKKGDGFLTYGSSDKKVAAVDKKGKVTIKGTGIATITVKAEETDKYREKTVKIAVKVKPEKAVIKSLNMVKGKKLKVTWKKDKRAAGYEIQYSTDSKFKDKKVTKTTIVKNKNTASKTFSKLKEGRKYYVRIRSYKNIKVNGKSQKLYGAWSNKKKSGSIQN